MTSEKLAVNYFPPEPEGNLDQRFQGLQILRSTFYWYFGSTNKSLYCPARLVLGSCLEPRSCWTCFEERRVPVMTQQYGTHLFSPTVRYKEDRRLPVDRTMKRMMVIKIIFLNHGSLASTDSNKLGIKIPRQGRPNKSKTPCLCLSLLWARIRKSQTYAALIDFR